MYEPCVFLSEILFYFPTLTNFWHFTVPKKSHKQILFKNNFHQQILNLKRQEPCKRYNYKWGVLYQSDPKFISRQLSIPQSAKYVKS
jgi:hypothetical protein